MSRRQCKKLCPEERHKIWKESFRQNAIDRSKSARQDLVHRRREDQWLQWAAAQEWEDFKNSHQDALKRVGIRDYAEIEDEKVSYCQQHQEPKEGDSQVWQHQENTKPNISEVSVDRPESITCIHCHYSVLRYIPGCSIPTLECPSCGFYATLQMIQSIQEHNTLCIGSIIYTYQPTSSGVIGLCSLCGTCASF
ncbi:hypothetical protein CLU79DRAFT_727556 [Phycomyces nitens]|nr:hypothetical protein CLU79DRAFT_727556 [Phycomyces nitens]